MSFLTRTALLLAMLSILTTPAPAHAQSDAAAIEGDLPIESYLSLLSQVALQRATVQRPTWRHSANAAAVPCRPSNCAAPSPKAAAIPP